MREIALNNSALRSAAKGADMAKQILDLLAVGESVRVDFASVEIMTPSFTNTFVMTLLERMELEEIRSRCEFANRSDHVLDAMNRAAKRFMAGIRLSSQCISA